MVVEKPSGMTSIRHPEEMALAGAATPIAADIDRAALLRVLATSTATRERATQQARRPSIGSIARPAA